MSGFGQTNVSFLTMYSCLKSAKGGAFLAWIPLVLFGALSTGVAAENGSSERNLSVARCGPIALEICCRFQEIPLDAGRLAALIPTEGPETSLAELGFAARDQGLSTVAVRWHELPQAHHWVPAIIPVVNANGRRHFVAMLGYRIPQQIIVADLLEGKLVVTEQALRENAHWDGTALHVGASAEVLDPLRQAVSRSFWAVRLRIAAGAAGGLFLAAAIYFGLRRSRPGRGAAAGSVDLRTRTDSCGT